MAARKIVESEAEWFSDVPRGIVKHTVFGILLLAVTFGGFGAWAFTAPIAAAVIANGSFVATGQNKIVQHLEGGIIEEILVSEGEYVTKGQPIVRLDETAAYTNDRQLWLRQARLEAINARLEAEARVDEAIAFPKELSANTADYEIAAIIRSQELNFTATKRKLDGEIGLLRSNMKALEHRADGYERQRDSIQRQLVFLEEEHEGKAELLRAGYLRKSEVSAIRRAMAEAEGQIGRLQAEIDETRAQIDKHEQQILQAQATYRQAALEERQSIEAELDGVREQALNARSVLRRATINAPVAGVIVRMHYHTAGGVVESGKAIAEITPADVPLIVEIQVPRTEIDSVRVGQKAVVRLTALNQRITPVLTGTVFYVSADALPDVRAGEAREVYVARVKLDPKEISRVPGFVPSAGMPAQIMIQTVERTFFDYLAKPIVDSMSRAFREQ